LQDLLENALQKAADKLLAAYTLTKTSELLEELIKTLVLVKEGPGYLSLRCHHW